VHASHHRLCEKVSLKESAIVKELMTAVTG
jgi:hypothetical protein